MAARRMARLLVAAAGVGSIALAQYALDANLKAGSGGVNARSRSRVPLGPDIYTVDRNTGRMVHNESTAFAQPKYDFNQDPPQMAQWNRPTQAPGQIYTVDRRTGRMRYDTTAAFEPSSYNPRVRANQVNVNPQLRTTPAPMPATATPRTSQQIVAASRPPGQPPMNAGPTRSNRAGSLAAPKYSPVSLSQGMY